MKGGARVVNQEYGMIRGNDERLARDGKISIRNGALGLLFTMICAHFIGGFSVLVAFLSLIMILTGISKKRAVGNCRIELKDTEFTVCQEGIFGKKVNTYQKDRVVNLKMVETKESLKKFQNEYEKREFVVQFQYEKQFVTLRPEQFEQIGQSLAKYFDYQL